MHRKRFLALAAAVALLLVVPAAANDTMAVLKTGGLIFVRSDVVSMKSEDLFISRKEVRVDYVFANRSDKTVEGIVAFPMPEIEANPARDGVDPQGKCRQFPWLRGDSRRQCDRART